MHNRTRDVVFFAFLSAAATSFGCASTPAAPFNNFKSAQITAFRLQNYEPPPQAAAPTAPGQIPGLPPEIQKWVQAGASMIPPGLLPPGLIPGVGAPAAPPVDNTPRFHNFRVLGMPTNVIDNKLREELISIFGFSKNFDAPQASCMYAEFGFSFSQMGQPPADILVSFSCDQVQAHNFMWPHKNVGLTNDTAARLTKAIPSIFGG